MHQFFFLGLFILCSSVTGQQVVFDERSTENYMNYFDQMQLIELSLKKGNLIDKINWADGKKITQDQFKALSDTFNKNIPNTFYSSENGTPLVTTEKITDPSSFIRWTYANVRDGEITVHLQLRVIFQVDKSGENIYFPKVDSIELKARSEIQTIDSRSLLKNYKKYIKVNKKNPPPPPPIKD
jgi:hypothetical protein